MSDLYAIIPAYEPLPSLPELIREILKIKLLKGVVVVDDGSVKEGTDKTFAEIDSIEGCVLLRHEKNKGKGASMKTAFKYLLEKDPTLSPCPR